MNKTFPIDPFPRHKGANLFFAIDFSVWWVGKVLLGSSVSLFFFLVPGLPFLFSTHLFGHSDHFHFADF